MNSRDRVLAALKHREPDRVPIDVCRTVTTTLHRNAYENLGRFLGFDELVPATTVEQKMWGLAPPDDRVLKRFGADAYPVYANQPSG
jgi:uroporphyrinogen decarboxylase